MPYVKLVPSPKDSRCSRKSTGMILVSSPGSMSTTTPRLRRSSFSALALASAEERDLDRVVRRLLLVDSADVTTAESDFLTRLDAPRLLLRPRAVVALVVAFDFTVFSSPLDVRLVPPFFLVAAAVVVVVVVVFLSLLLAGAAFLGAAFFFTTAVAAFSFFATAAVVDFAVSSFLFLGAVLLSSEILVAAKADAFRDDERRLPPSITG